MEIQLTENKIRFLNYCLFFYSVTLTDINSQDTNKNGKKPNKSKKKKGPGRPPGRRNDKTILREKTKQMEASRKRGHTKIKGKI